MKLTYVDILIILIGFVIGWMSTANSKTQFVRILDVVFYGPILIYIVIKHYIQLSIEERIMLYIMGTTTISYNLRNYLKNHK